VKSVSGDGVVQFTLDTERGKLNLTEAFINGTHAGARGPERSAGSPVVLGFKRARATIPAVGLRPTRAPAEALVDCSRLRADAEIRGDGTAAALASAFAVVASLRTRSDHRARAFL
jgi:hypothetical protein